MRILIFIIILMIGVTSVMAEENERKNSIWYSGEVQYEGFPLHLRFPEKPDFDALQKKFPNFLSVTHKLEKVTSSGIPESVYNESLADFDHELTEAFSTPLAGMTVLIETYGGNRTYYMYVSLEAEIEATKFRFNKNYPNHQLDWELSKDPNWKFIRGYSKDYNFY